MEARMQPDGGYHTLKNGQPPAQSMRSKNLRNVEDFLSYDISHDEI